MSSKRIAAAALVVLLLGSVAAACGGGGGGDGNKLGASDQLRVAQARADLDEFCSVSNAPKNSDLYDRAYFSSVDAVNKIIAYYKKSPSKVYVDKIKHLELTTKQVAENAAKDLDKCGKDGKDEAAKLRAALQQS